METSALIQILILALVLWLIWFVVGKFMPGTPATIIGVILGLILLVTAVNRMGLLSL